jgi:hypothetical protein
MAPKKLFREEAEPGNVECLSCGGPITLHGYGQIEQVSCPYCGSTLSPDQNGALELLQAAQRQRRPSVLQLHSRGKLKNSSGQGDDKETEWEIIGVAWRQVTAEGVAYPWQEFMLFNPYHGYRWLIYSMTDGSWMLGEALDGAPEKVGLAHKALRFQGDRFKHFSTGQASVIYVEGEFPWQVEVGDVAIAEDYVAKARGLSVEHSTSEGGSEVSFTRMRHIDSDEVWAAFGGSDKAPPQNGIGLLTPNPNKARSGWFWKTCLILLALWTVATFIYVGSRDTKVIVTESNVPVGTSLSQSVEVLEEGDKGTLEVEFSLPGLSNAWGYADVLLVKEGSQDAYNFGVEVDEWHGSDYKEGTNPKSLVIGGVEGGKYTLQVTPKIDPAHLSRNPSATYNLTVRQDVALIRYSVLAFLMILMFPLFNTLLGGIYEGRRWQNSDYASED